MHLTFQFVICVTAAVASGQHQAVTMNLSYEGSKNFVIPFKLTSAMFQLFYECLCKAETQLCNLSYDLSDHMIKGVQQFNSTESLTPTQCKVYGCTNSAQSNKVICNFLRDSQVCAREVKPTFWSLNVPSSCSASCVGFAWNLKEENLTTNDRQLQLNQCGYQCCSGVPSVQTPHLNESSREHLEISKSVQKGNYRDTYIVGGIAAGVVVVAIVVFVSYLLIKRRTGSATGQREASSATQSSTNWIHHGFYPNKTVINGNTTHGDGAGKEAGINLHPINVFAGLGLNNAGNTAGQQLKDKDTENVRTHNKHDKKGQVRGKGLFKRKSNTSAGSNDESGNDNACDHSGEGDYAEIDDLQIQDSNSVEHTQNSKETDANDGYSSVDNSDYYNINANTLSTAVSNIGGSREVSRDFFSPKDPTFNMDSSTGVKMVHHQHSDSSVQQRNFSEYSVAKEIVEETPTYSMGQQMDRQSLEPKLRSEGDQGHASDRAEDDSKRNTYFILEREADEPDI